MLLDFHVSLTQEEYQKVYFENDYDFWPAYEQEAYVLGSLVIDIADSKNSAVIWQSKTRRYMNPEDEVNSRTINRSVRRALQNFPPKAAKLDSN